jgi:predicted Zn-dependent peptidase
VILEEIGMYNDRPQWRLQDTLLEEYFRGHPLSFRVLGTEESIAALTAGQMREYFGQHYSASHVTVAAAGRLDFAALIADLEKLTAGWNGAGPPRRYDAPPTAAVRKALVDAKLNRHYVALVCPAPSAQDPGRYAARILADVLGDADGSRLYWSLVDPGLADEADFSHAPSDRVGTFVAYASCDPERAGQVEEILLKAIDGLADSLQGDEIERAKNKLATLATIRGERPLGRMMNLGGQWLVLQQYIPLETELERLMAVTLDDVRALAKPLPTAPRAIVHLGPQ